ncbi:MAG: thiol reductase thioredoxin [Flavobacteriia bacterium]|nr:MAG: thiol reductase thioredoxin [Flavobacteriia bacterium]
MKHVLTTLLMLCIAVVSAQEFNQEIELENGQKLLVGKINLDGLQSEPYNNWFHKGHNDYTVDETMVSLFKKKLAKHDIKLFLGTWCGDSKREVPRMIKILETAQYPMDQLEIIALDRRQDHYKKSPTGEEKGLNIIKVPTLIFFKDGKEVNRIVESPLETLEEDMAQILLKKSYTPNYAY